MIAATPMILNPKRLRANRAFTLIELVIVIVIIGVIAAIAVPRMSRGAKGASEGGLTADLAVMRNAIELYKAEHGGTPPTLANFVAQMTQYSDVNGGTSGTKDATHIYGPYLREIPTLKVGTGKGVSAVIGTADGSGGWVYNQTAGTVVVNLLATETDDSGKPYNSY